MRAKGETGILSMDRRELLKAGASGLIAASLPAAAWAQTPKSGGTLLLSSGGDPPTLDMHQSATYLTEFVCSPCFSTLLRSDPTDINKLIPDLAEKYEVSPDGMMVTFHLHAGAEFHNGMPVTAEDVAFSLDRIRKPPKGIVSPRKGLLGNVKEVEAKDPVTVIVHLSAPQADFAFQAAIPYNVISPMKVGEPLDASGQGMKRTVVF